MKNAMLKAMLVPIAAALMLTGGCATSNSAQKNAMIGAGVGAAAGALLNKKNRGAGAGIGAAAASVLGYIYGNEKDKAEALRQQEEYRRRQQTERRRTGTIRTTTVVEVLDENGNIVRTGKTTTTSTARDPDYVDVNDYKKPK